MGVWERFRCETRKMEKIMKLGSIKGWSWSGALAATAFFLAPEAHAIGLCPKTNEYIVISCNNCSRELTCDGDGATIYITGNYVTLDGKGRFLRRAPATAITVSGYASIIKNVNLDNPGNHGLLISNDPYTGLSHWIDHVEMWNPAQVGYYIVSANPVTLSYCKVTGAGNTSFVLRGAKNVDVKNCVSTSTKGNGAYSNSNNSFILNSTFSGGSANGFQAEAAKGLVFSGNHFDNNSYLGLTMYNVSASVKSNFGSGNRNLGGGVRGNDCYETHDTPQSFSTGGNAWGLWQGTGCTP